jgi:hypothetical protein
MNGESGQRVGSKEAVAPEGYIVGEPPSEKNKPEHTTRIAADQSNANIVMPPRPGEWQERQKPPPIPPDDEKSDKKKDLHQKNLASKRGRDWALPNAANGSVPITRPIKVECRADQITILPETGQSGGKTIPIGTRTEASTQAFISAVWEHMGTWGIAGRGMYWRPVLNVYVTPDGEQRFADLQMLMEGSGLKIVRK